MSTSSSDPSSSTSIASTQTGVLNTTNTAGDPTASQAPRPSQHLRIVIGTTITIGILICSCLALGIANNGRASTISAAGRRILAAGYQQGVFFIFPC